MHFSTGTAGVREALLGCPQKNFDKPNNMIWAQVEEASVNKHEMHDRHNYLNA